MEKTIDIGSSFADSSDRIDLEIEFDPDYTRDSSSRVSVQRLSIPEDAQKRLLKVEELLKEHEVEEAIEKLKQLIDQFPEYSDAWNRLGTIYFLNGNFRESERHFRQALRLDPESYPPVVNLGAALLSLGALEEAQEYNSRAVDLRPQDPLAHSQLGQTFFAKGVLESAIRHLKLAKELDPGHFSYPQLVLAEIYRLQGKDAAMQREIESFLKYHPDISFADDLKEYLPRPRDGGGADQE
jgi:tetratricopeptide (TPR) repeat protein